MSLRDKFAAAAKLREKEIDVPEVGKVLVREMTAASLTEITRGRDPLSPMTAIHPYIAIGCAFDPETKEQVWKRNDVDSMKEWPPRILKTIIETWEELSRVGPTSLAETEKNSGATGEDSSSLPSPVSLDIP